METCPSVFFFFFFKHVCRSAACLDAVKKKKWQWRWMCPAAALSYQSRAQTRTEPGKRVRELSLLPSSLTGTIQVQKVWGKDNRRWVTDRDRSDSASVGWKHCMGRCLKLSSGFIELWMLRDTLKGFVGSGLSTVKKTFTAGHLNLEVGQHVSNRKQERFRVEGTYLHL